MKKQNKKTKTKPKQELNTCSEYVCYAAVNFRGRIELAWFFICKAFVALLKGQVEV